MDRKKSVLVTGGAGYIGIPLVQRLLGDSDTIENIVVYDNLLYGENLVHLLGNSPRLQFIKADINDPCSVDTAVNGIDYIVHLAAVVGVHECEQQPELARITNIEGTRNLANAAKKYNVQKFIFASTCSVYGTQKDICTEDTLRQPINIYSETKIAAEDILLNEKCFNHTILRFGTLFGAESGKSRDYLAINYFVHQALEKKHIEIYSPDSMRPYVYLGDAVDAITLALVNDDGTADGKIYNVAAQNYSRREIIFKIARYIPVAALWTFSDSPDKDPRNYMVSSDKISRELDWLPKTSVKEGIASLVDKWRT
jgi:nucleoside-diphosphate-sugar epimerase